uniref:Uncharacterized protein n=1 Tax=Globisporangium ultimum (strain ATCC 200006 / CBS 805.95 / DAOM BR144) TaxID=431595 RepID=K3WAG0_GLOUD
MTHACTSNLVLQYEKCNRSIKNAILFAYGSQLVWCGLGQLFMAAYTVFAPVVLHQVVLAFSGNGGSEDVDSWTLGKWLSAFFAIRLINVFVTTQVNNTINHIMLRLAAAIRSMVFQKAMRTVANRDHLAKSRSHKPVDINNLVTSDATDILTALTKIHSIWILPLQIIVETYLLYSVMDAAAFAGVAVILLTLSVNYFASKVMAQSYSKWMKVKDQRMQTVKELFGVIQIVKFNAWEDRFKSKLLAERAQELQKLAEYSYAGAVSTFVLWSSPLVVSTVSFAVYALVLKQTLTAAKVFTAMALFNALRDPLRDLPATIQLLIQSRVSIARLDQFLKSPEVDTSNVVRRDHDTSLGSFAVEVTAGRFAWSSASSGLESAGFTLKDIQFRVNSGDLVVIYGGVGAGKSSLCSALLGEMNKVHGTVEVRGRVAYYSQQPWIQNMSIRDNILFGAAFDAKRYNAVLNACCLCDDLEQFPAGDATEIGEKGVNLSGGQKARVSLARACYADADVYILDSPLAAVDTVVQKVIFGKCICGLLADKTIFLVTHNPEIIASSAVSYRIGLENGELKENLRVGGASKRRDMLTLAGSPNDAIDTAKPKPTSKTQQGDGVLIHKEHREEGKVSRAVWWRYLNAIGGMRMMVVLLISQLLWQGFQVASDFWLSHWTGRNHTQSNGSEDAELSYFIEIYAGLAAAGATMVLARGVIVTSMGLQASRYLFAAMTEGLLRSPLRFFDANPIGRIINRFAGDISIVDKSLPKAVGVYLSSVFATVGALITTGIFIQYFGILFLPVVLVYVHLAQGYARAYCNILRLLKVVLSPMLSHIAQSEHGVAVLRAFGGAYVVHAVNENHRLLDLDNALWDTEIVLIQWFVVRLQLLGCGILVITMGSLLLFREMFPPGIVGLVFSYALSIDASLMTLTKAWSDAENDMVSVERVLEYSVLPEEGMTSDATTTKSPSWLQIEPQPCWPERGEISFESVSFNYKPNDPLVLKNTSFVINSHEKIGIVGRTGAGKSSLTMALFRINVLVSGRILIDGVDVATLPLRVLRSRMSIIPQSPVLLKGTLRNFVDPFEDFTDTEIIQVLDHVELLPKLRRFIVSNEINFASANGDDGPDAGVLAIRLSANGENFSVGERQMMCLARALLKRSSIVIMDEATAAMDHATETKVSTMIRRELKHVTLLTIAHRLATVMDSDRILVLSGGQVVEFDTPANLLRNPRGVFSGLVQDASTDVRKRCTTEDVVW